MKKLLALMMAICLMTLPTVVLADSVLQDAQAPQIVTTTGESGETIYAVIRDAQGNVVAQITDESALVLSDVSARDAANDRLAKAFQSVTDALLHGDVLTGLDPHDLAVYDLFDVSLADDVAAQITEGGSIELKLQAHPALGAPVAALFTADGTQWQAADFTQEGDVITVTIPASGVVAMLCDAQSHQGADAAITADSETSGNFTPSVSGKPSPEVVAADGDVIGYIHTPGSEEPIAVPDQNYVVTTSVAQRDSIADIMTHELLEKSYENILAAANVGELANGALAAELDAALQQMGLELTHDQLVVKDLFAVTAYGDYLHALCDEENYLEMTFDPQVEPGAPMVVIHSVDGETWHVHTGDDVTLNDDGTVTLRLHDLGAVAFLVEKEFTIDAEGAVQAP